MKSTEALSALRRVGKPVVSTREAALVGDLSPVAMSQTLRRLAESGLVTCVSKGVWNVGEGQATYEEVLPVLTNPYPSYLSLWTALFRHGMIEQIPRSVSAVTLGRSKRISTTLGLFDIHHIPLELYGDVQGETGVSAGIARPEKALFDTVYFLSNRCADVTLPELELPEGFSSEVVNGWVEKIVSRRLQTLTRNNLERVLQTARR